MSDYEKQLEEANQRLREQLEKETARADMLEKKLKENEWRGLKNPKDVNVVAEELVKVQPMSNDVMKKFMDMYQQIQKKKNKF